ncbi:hypothetical protein CR513_14733, partial [Mucuna pruriens]
MSRFVYQKAPLTLKSEEQRSVAYALTTPRLDFIATNKHLIDWTQANKVCRHTLISTLSNELFNVYCSYKEEKHLGIHESC